MRRGRPLRALLLAVFTLGCVHVEGTVPPRHLTAGSGSFLAGAARIDITPIPGIAMGGHSIVGRVSRGYWSRLHARAVYLEDHDGRGIALVQCDLWSIAGGLSDRVALLLATRPDLLAKLGGRRLGREQLVLAATHTHHSPALFSTDLFFANFAGPEGGFDEALFEFLAQRIAWAVAEAVSRARPARVYERQDTLEGTFRNRSMEAFRANPEARSILEANEALPPCEPHPEYPDPEACRGVDPRAVSLRVQASSGELIAAVVVFAAHPTLVSHLSSVYSADLHGAVALGLERRLAAAVDPGAPDDEPIVAVFNGAEGDVSGTWTTQTREDVMRIAAVIVDRVGSGFDGPSSGGWRRVDGDVAFRFERVGLRGRRVHDPDGDGGRTAWIPMPGRACIQGAEDGRSGAPPFFFEEGKRGLDIGPHGTKVGALDLLEVFGFTLPPFWLTRLLTLVLPPPVHVGMGVYRLGPLRLATLPGEFTTVQGRRIAAALAPPRGRREDVVLIGLAHDYAYYFTTPEEYQLQHYEGAATLYGRWSGAYAQSRLAALSADLDAGPSAEAAYGFAHRTGFRHAGDTRDVETSPARLDRGTAPVAGAEAADDAAHPRVCWRDTVPRLGGRGSGPCATRRGGWECATPRVSVELQTASGWRTYVHRGVPQDDEGLSFLTLAGRAEDDDAQATCWCSFWLVPDGTDPTAPFRFRVETLEGGVVHSEVFDGETAAASPPEGCTPR